MKIILASKNNDKIEEIKKILNKTDVELLTWHDTTFPDVEETGSTFVENALLKAKSASKATGLGSIADDSGIEVNYLNGKPGIKSARYAGNDATNEENNIKLLNELLDVPFEDRKASYRCVIVYMRFPDDPYPFISFGSWDGYIGLEPKGKNGFGYDPIFYLPEYEQTSAQISSSEKNKISHRAKALLKLEEFISRT
ncbi:MAG: RdgB/HAM1 family non-canonical purine NTP pyrophosphatase [Pseudomonadota bacterium]|nr:RdgB/HAM1 family non-canonical purine NTP pyrophosphatase [Pseudomonadota bacterium]